MQRLHILPQNNGVDQTKSDRSNCINHKEKRIIEKKLLSSEKQQQLHEQLERITTETEQRLTKIRKRRREQMDFQSGSE